MIRRIFIDMDGVVANFAGHFCGKYGRDVAECKGVYWLPHVLDIQDFEEHLNEPKFWQEIPAMEGACHIVESCERYCKKVAFLTSPGKWPVSATAKLFWVESHFPHMRKRTFIGNEKEILAGPESLLIEDHDDNVKAFEKEGGRAILIPRHWNSEYRKEAQWREIFDRRLAAAFEGVVI